MCVKGTALERRSRSAYSKVSTVHTLGARCHASKDPTQCLEGRGRGVPPPPSIEEDWERPVTGSGHTADVDESCSEWSSGQAHLRKAPPYLGSLVGAGGSDVGGAGGRRCPPCALSSLRQSGLRPLQVAVAACTHIYMAIARSLCDCECASVGFCLCRHKLSVCLD